MLQEILEIVRGQERRQVPTNQLRDWLIEKRAQETLSRAFELSKTGEVEVGKHLATKWLEDQKDAVARLILERAQAGVGGILSYEVARGSRDQGESD